MDGYRVPKRQIPARVALTGQPPAVLSLYLADRAKRHSGRECPSDLLNSRREFIPATDADGRLVVFRRSSVTVLTVDAEYEDAIGGESSNGGKISQLSVELRLEDGTRVRGELSYWRPEGQRRVQDYLNTAEQFVPVLEGQVVHLVNRDRIVSLLKRLENSWLTSTSSSTHSTD